MKLQGERVPRVRRAIPTDSQTPQFPAVAVAAVGLRQKRNELRTKHRVSLRETYCSLELPGDHPLKAAQVALDDESATTPFERRASRHCHIHEV